MESLAEACVVLRHRSRYDLANLLARATVDFVVPHEWGDPSIAITIRAPLSDYDHLRALPKEDKQTIQDVVLEVWPERAEDMPIQGVVYRLNRDSLTDAPDDADNPLQHSDRIRDLMIAVATGGPRIESVNAEYKERYSKLTELLETFGLHNPIPYTDLWDWYGKWSSGDLPTYQSRRQYIRSLFAPVETRLREEPPLRGAEMFPEPTGWPRVDRTLDKVRTSLASASTEVQFQAVGLMCREALFHWRRLSSTPSDILLPTDWRQVRLMPSECWMDIW